MSAPEKTSPAWTDQDLRHNPHQVADKATRVRNMFAAIAPSYDLNNRLHALGMDQYWRRVTVDRANVRAGETVVDVACGTGDLTLKFARRLSQQGGGTVLGVDFTYEMLPIAQRKGQRHADQYQNVGLQWINGDALALPLADASADVVSIAFGIRNVSDWGRAIDEFVRVLRPGGRLLVLEFSLPTNPVLRGLYNLYFRHIMPHTATLLSGDRSGAYKYLPESVNTFITRAAMQQRFTQAGLTQVDARALTAGICVCYRGVKP